MKFCVDCKYHNEYFLPWACEHPTAERYRCLVTGSPPLCEAMRENWRHLCGHAAKGFKSEEDQDDSWDDVDWILRGRDE